MLTEGGSSRGENVITPFSFFLIIFFIKLLFEGISVFKQNLKSKNRLFHSI